MFALFVGHDHSNDYVNDFEGFLLGYGRKTGYGCYGPPKGCVSVEESESVECSVVVVFFRFREKDFNMETFIVNENLTHEVQKPGKAQLKPQDVCNGMKPPMK